MPKTKNETKALKAFKATYGKAGIGIFYATLNARGAGSKMAKAVGKGAVKAAKSGGRGRTKGR